MNAQLNIVNEDPRREKVAPASFGPYGRFVYRHSSAFGWRHVEGVAIIRLLVAVWLVVLGTIFFAYGYWGWGVALYVMATMVGSLAYCMPRWKQLLDAAPSSN